ncbi:MAG: endonuclease III [Candidatus Eisenbacteria bacterium]|nr:endonuclease III [Candidatus Eisenbacteria bacterium]
MDERNIDGVLSALRRDRPNWKDPVHGDGTERRRERDPFRTLIGCVLSLRTKDETTEGAAERLFAIAPSPEAMVRLRTAAIEKAIYPVGFYRNKARTVREIARILIERHGGRVPDRMKELLALPGVGRKTANLVLIRAHDKAGICVDVHVHRIVNRWGYVATRSPDETEAALRAKLPRRHWKTLNGLLIVFGRQVCKPVSPFCSLCVVEALCPRIGVTRSR